MPICIECSYPVPQLFHVLHSSSKTHKSHAAPPSPINNHSESPYTTNPSPANNLGSTSSARDSIPSVSSIAQVKPVTSLNSKSGYSNQIPARGAKGFGEVRLTQCPRCKRFADKYVEHDFVVLFIDLVLVKPQVGLNLAFLHGYSGQRGCRENTSMRG